jgi:arylsulfatase A-like enzyme
MSYFKTILCTGVFLLIFSCKSKHSDSDADQSKSVRPNIVFILADDFGIVDTQAYAKKFTGATKEQMYHETPNIDKLINEGTSFSQAYANQLCSPTRASILTGKYAGRLGFTTAMPLRDTYYNQNLPIPEGYYGNDVLEHKDKIAIEQALINGISNSAVSTGTKYDNGKDEHTIAEALSDYHSAFIGKWHVGGFGAEGYQPADNGFEPLAWFDGGGSAYFNWRRGWNNKTKNKYPNMPQDEWQLGDGGKETNEKYLTDDLTVQALNYIDKRAEIKDEPFFLYFSHFAVHSPYQGKKEIIEHFENKKTKGWNGHKDPIYASMIKSLDNSVGAILDKLKEKGLEENTIVVFMSDNGGIDSKVTPKGDGTDNTPFLGGKACLTEGGIRVPLVFRWKGKINAGQWVDVPVDCTDIYPTLLEVAGYNSEEIISKYDLDGEEIYSLLSDTENKNDSYSKDTHYWHYPFNVVYNNPYDGLPLTPHSAIRDGDYKLIFDWYGRLYLYDIENDPFEKNNLAEKMPELKDKLFNKLTSWIKMNIDKRYWPSVNPDYNPKNESRDIPFLDKFSNL